MTHSRNPYLRQVTDERRSDWGHSAAHGLRVSAILSSGSPNLIVNAVLLIFQFSLYFFIFHVCHSLFTKIPEYDDLIAGYYQHRGGTNVLLFILDGIIFIPEITSLRHCWGQKFTVYRIAFVSVSVLMISGSYVILVISGFYCMYENNYVSNMNETYLLAAWGGGGDAVERTAALTQAIHPRIHPSNCFLIKKTCTVRWLDLNSTAITYEVHGNARFCIRSISD
jgi:hypothetical protein